jgi:AcrR family transcriptional regulator
MSPKIGIEPVRQAQIIEAALRLIARHGSHNVSIQSVATEAGLSKGAVLHYYPTKEALFAAVFREFFRQIFERSKTTMDRYDDPVEKIRSFEWLFDDNDPTMRLGYPIYLECMARAVYEELFRGLIREWLDNWVTLLTDAIEAGIRSGQFKEVNAEEAARAISAFCQGICTRWYLHRERHHTPWARETLRNYTEALLTKEQKARSGNR